MSSRQSFGLMRDLLVLLSMPFRIVWWLAVATANSALVLCRLKRHPPTGSPVWRRRWRRS